MCESTCSGPAEQSSGSGGPGRLAGEEGSLQGKLLQVSSSQKAPTLPNSLPCPQAAVVRDPRGADGPLCPHLWSLMAEPAQSKKTESDRSRVEGGTSRRWASPGVIPRAAFPAELFQGRPECLSRHLAPGGASQAQGDRGHLNSSSLRCVTSSTSSNEPPSPTTPAPHPAVEKCPRHALWLPRTTLTV